MVDYINSLGLKEVQKSQSSLLIFFLLVTFYAKTNKKVHKIYLNLVVSSKVIFCIAILLIFFHNIFRHVKISNRIP